MGPIRRRGNPCETLPALSPSSLGADRGSDWLRPPFWPTRGWRWRWSTSTQRSIAAHQMDAHRVGGGVNGVGQRGDDAGRWADQGPPDGEDPEGGVGEGRTEEG